MPADASRRFLVAAGTEHYDSGDELASVPEDLRKITRFFGGLGYREQLPEVRLDPSSSVLKSALSQWLKGSDRQASDTAVIYYSGHGDSQASYFYLLTADSRESWYEATALRADYVVEALGEIPKVCRLLLVLDACYAGQGAFDAASIAARMAPWQNFNGDDEGIWVIAAASPKQEAQERLFADAFIEAAEQLQQTGDKLQPYIGLEALIWQINEILKRSGKQQRASWIPATQAKGLAPFIPNPRYQPGAPADVDLETRDWLRRRHSAELAEYWGPKARGVEVAAQAGWYFTGRRAALAELAKWLADPDADTRLRVLTGDPGSGKSAVLGRLVTLADPSSPLRAPGLAADPGSVPPAGSITAALLAKGKTAGELMTELAASLGAGPDTELAGTLDARPVFTVVIDALDEATDPPTVIQNFISPLHAAASPGRGPRLLVATRRYQHLLELLPAERVTVDLDRDSYYSDADTASYVAKVLLAADDPDSPTPYRDQPDLAGAAGRQVAAVAGHSFLIAQIAARTLARSPWALGPAAISADRERWRDVGAAFDRDLDRYGEQAHRVRALLTPLAWAEGGGLPRELWAPLATALDAAETYTQADITWLLEHAGFYLVETLDQDRSVYRLYHEQFAEHLRASLSPTSAHERITAELLRHVPVSADGRREWLAATPYIRAQLATHAANAHVLDPLVNDPGFLLAADPWRLLPALATVTDPEACKSASAFESIQPLLSGQPPGQAAAQLDLAARIHSATMLTDGIGRLPYNRPWTIAWGHWTRQDRHVLLGLHTGADAAVAATTVDGIPVAVSGGRDGTIQVWDLRTGTARGEPLRGHDGQVRAVTVGEVDGTPVAVSGGDDGTVRVWDLRTGTARGEPLRCHDHPVVAVAVREVDGTPVVVTGGPLDDTARVWDLRTGTARGESFRGDHLGWGSAAVGEVDGTLIAVTGAYIGDTARVWDLRTGTARGEPLRGSAFAIGEVDGTPVAVTASQDGTVQMWDLRTGRPRGGPLRGHEGPVRAVAVAEVDRTPVAVTGGHDKTVRVWDLRTGTARGEPLRGHGGGVGAVAVAQVDGTPVAVTGGQDGTVRMWHLQAGTTLGEPLRGVSDAVLAVAVAEVDGTPVAVTGCEDKTVRVWDLRTGTARGEPLRGHGWPVQVVAVAEVDGTPVAVTGANLEDTVRMWDLRTGAARGEIGPIHGPSKVAVGEVDGTPVAVIVEGIFNDAVRVWDLRTGTARGELVPGREGFLYAVAVGEMDGTPIAVTHVQDGTVRAWDLRTGVARGEPLRVESGTVLAVAVGEMGGTPVAVTGGQDGTVRVWDLRTGAARGETLRGHSGRVVVVAVGEVDGILVAVTGDDNGMILKWALGYEQRASARLDIPEKITAVAFAGQAGWLILTQDGSLFLWHSSPTLGRHFRGSLRKSSEVL